MTRRRIAELEARLEDDRARLRAGLRTVRWRLGSPPALLAAFGGGFAAARACARPSPRAPGEAGEATDVGGAGHLPLLRRLPWGWLLRGAWRWLTRPPAARD